MYASDFVYDGVSLSSFGCVICRFDGDAGIEEIQAGAPLNFVTVSRRKGNIFSLVDLNYESALEATFDICKDPCEDNDMVISDQLYLDLSRWLLRNEFLDVYFLNDDHIIDRHYNGSFNMSKLMVDDKLCGLRLTMTTDKPYAVGDEIVASVGYGNKNLLYYPYEDTTKTQNGMTFTDNGDGSITINGTSTGFAAFRFAGFIELDVGEYTLSIGTSSLDNTRTNISATTEDIGGMIGETSTNQNPLNFGIPSNEKLYGLSIYFQSGKTVNNVTIYPMLTPISSSTSTWEPPSMSTYRIDADSPFLLDDDSYITGTIIPDVEVRCRESGDLILTNSYTGTNMVIKNCTEGEVITVNGSTLDISSSESSHKLYNDFNFNYLKIGNSYHDKVNSITSSIKCDLTIKYKPIIRDAP